jgi:hypothetical protein
MDRVAVGIEDDDIHLDEINAGDERRAGGGLLLGTDEGSCSSQGPGHDPGLCVGHKGNVAPDQVRSSKFEVQRIMRALRTSNFILRTLNLIRCSLCFSQ